MQNAWRGLAPSACAAVADAAAAGLYVDAGRRLSPAVLPRNMLNRLALPPSSPAGAAVGMCGPPAHVVFRQSAHWPADQPLHKGHRQAWVAATGCCCKRSAGLHPSTCNAPNRHRAHTLAHPACTARLHPSRACRISGCCTAEQRQLLPQLRSEVGSDNLFSPTAPLSRCRCPRVLSCRNDRCAAHFQRPSHGKLPGQAGHAWASCQQLLGGVLRCFDRPLGTLLHRLRGSGVAQAPVCANCCVRLPSSTPDLPFLSRRPAFSPPLSPPPPHAPRPPPSLAAHEQRAVVSGRHCGGLTGHHGSNPAAQLFVLLHPGEVLGTGGGVYSACSDALHPKLSKRFACLCHDQPPSFPINSKLLPPAFPPRYCKHSKTRYIRSFQEISLTQIVLLPMPSFHCPDALHPALPRGGCPLVVSC